MKTKHQPSALFPSVSKQIIDTAKSKDKGEGEGVGTGGVGVWVGSGGENGEEQRRLDTHSIPFRHLPPNSARFGYATEGALFIGPATRSAPSERFGY